MAYKMKGYTYPGTSPMKDGDKVAKSVTTDEFTISEDAPERGADKFKRVVEETKAATGGPNPKKDVLAANYGGTWTKKADKDGNILWMNQDGENVKQAARNEGLAKAEKKAAYIKANKTT